METRCPPSWSLVGTVEGRTGCRGRGGDDQDAKVASPLRHAASLLRHLRGGRGWADIFAGTAPLLWIPAPSPRLSPGLTHADAVSGEAISSLRAISGTFTSSPAPPRRQEMFGVVCFFFPFCYHVAFICASDLAARTVDKEQRRPLVTGKETKIIGAQERGARPRSRTRQRFQPLSAASLSPAPSAGHPASTATRSFPRAPSPAATQLPHPTPSSCGHSHKRRHCFRKRRSFSKIKLESPSSRAALSPGAPRMRWSGGLGHGKRGGNPLGCFLPLSSAAAAEIRPRSSQGMSGALTPTTGEGHPELTVQGYSLPPQLPLGRTTSPANPLHRHRLGPSFPRTSTPRRDSAEPPTQTPPAQPTAQAWKGGEGKCRASLPTRTWPQ